MVEKSADIFQATFEHYFKMAMDHHTKTGTTSNILIGIVAALIALVGYDGKVCGNVDIASGAAISVIGLFAHCGFGSSTNFTTFDNLLQMNTKKN